MKPNRVDPVIGNLDGDVPVGFGRHRAGPGGICDQVITMKTICRCIVFTLVLFIAAALGEANFACEDKCQVELDQSIKKCMSEIDFSSSKYDRCINNAFVVYRACMRDCVEDDYFQRRKDSP